MCQRLAKQITPTRNRQRKVRWLGTLLVALALAGCTSPEQYIRNCFKVGPNYGRPPAPIADDWIDAADVRVRKDKEEEARWWSAFNDPVLNSLVCFASQQNITLRQAGFRVLQARAQLDFSVGNLFPQQQTMNGSFTQTGLSTEVANLQPNLQRFFPTWSYGFGLAWEVDFWGRFRRAVEAADATLDASVENYDDVLVTLCGDVATAYVQIRTLQQQIEYARANVSLQREALAIAKARFAGGQTSELDVDQSISTLAQTESLIPALEISLRQATNRLCILLGQPPEDMLAKLASGPIPSAKPDVAVGMPAELLRRRPDIRRAERLAAAQSARIGVTEADFYPAISILGQVGYSAKNFPDLFNTKAFNGSIGPSFQWNILNYGRILANVRFQDALFQDLVANYQQTVLNANAEVENGLVTFLKAQQQTRFLAESVDAAQKALKVAIAQYKGGTVDFNRVDLLEQNLVQQQDQYAQARSQIALGLIQVYRALGGGWQIRLIGCEPGPVPTPAAPEPPDRGVPARPPEAMSGPKMDPSWEKQ